MRLRMRSGIESADMACLFCELRTWLDATGVQYVPVCTDMGDTKRGASESNWIDAVYRVRSTRLLDTDIMEFTYLAV